jgi:hypothetical protein
MELVDRGPCRALACVRHLERARFCLPSMELDSPGFHLMRRSIQCSSGGCATHVPRVVVHPRRPFFFPGIALRQWELSLARVDMKPHSSRDIEWLGLCLALRTRKLLRAQQESETYRSRSVHWFGLCSAHGKRKLVVLRSNRLKPRRRGSSTSASTSACFLHLERGGTYMATRKLVTN